MSSSTGSGGGTGDVGHRRDSDSGGRDVLCVARSHRCSGPLGRGFGRVIGVRGVRGGRCHWSHDDTRDGRTVAICGRSRPYSASYASSR